MRYIVLPIEDAKIFFSEEELATSRKNIDGTEVIMHEEILLAKRASLGLQILPTEDTGVVEWPYPVYDYGNSLSNLLNSAAWTCPEEII